MQIPTTTAAATNSSNKKNKSSTVSGEANPVAIDYVSLCNQGASLHHQGRYDDALSLFWWSFVTFSESVAGHVPFLKELRDFVETHVNGIRRTHCDCFMTADKNASSTMEFPSFVCSQPMVHLVSSFPPSSLWNCDDPKTAMIYNCAVSFHLRGLKNRCRRYLEAASLFYELLEQMVPYSTSLRHSLFFNLCLWNNLGQISYALGDEQQARKHFFCLSNYMLRLTTWAFLDPQYCDGFFLNVMALKGTEVAPAA